MINHRAISFVLACSTLVFVAKGQNSGPTPSPEEQSVRRVIKHFIDARDRHDGAAAADTYLRDGEYINSQGDVTHGREALTQLWNGLGEVRRTIQKLDIITPNIALVKVQAEFSGPTWALSATETFLLI